MAAGKKVRAAADSLYMTHKGKNGMMMMMMMVVEELDARRRMDDEPRGHNLYGIMRT